MPYTDSPFTVVFLREGNLWLAEVGGRGEWQLTDESVEWPIRWYAVSPDCSRIAYIPYQGPETLDALIKQVRISDGMVGVLTGADDLYSECAVAWLDNTHITYKLQEEWVAGHDRGLDVFTDNHIVFDLTTGERTVVPESLFLSQSPDGHYWLTCSRYYVYEGECDYKLHDLTTGEQWDVAESIGWGGFVDWSPDSKHILFTAFRDPNDFSIQLVMVDTATRQERTITSDDVTVIGADWSPDSREIAFTQCHLEDNPWFHRDCALWLVSRDGSDMRRIPVEGSFEGRELAWTPDGSRIVSAMLDENVPTAQSIWSVRIDGSDLRPVALNADSFAGSIPTVLCSP